MARQWKMVALVAAIAVLLVGLALTVGLVWVTTTYAQGPDPSDTNALVQQMLRMMDAVHGAGASERMLQTPGGEEMVKSCAQGMAQVQSMGGMMGGMPGANNMSDMMRQMMGNPSR